MAVRDEKNPKANLIYDIVQMVKDILFRIDSHTVVILIHTAVALQEQILEGHQVLFFVSHNQLVVQAKENKL